MIVGSVFHSNWLRRYTKMYEIAKRIDELRFERAKWFWKLATGCDWDGCAVHNASISDLGSGWGSGPHGAYVIEAARIANEIEASRYAPFRIVDRWDRRVRMGHTIRASS